MRRNLLGVALWASLEAAAAAQGRGVTVSDTSAADLHNHNRVIAFGSVMLKENGSDLSLWKEVRVNSTCGGASEPLPPPSGFAPAGGTPRLPADTPRCDYKLMVTTHYRFLECDNGRSFILRSGEGIIVRSRSEGEIFGWSEDASCGSGPMLEGVDTLDGSRPLDLANIRIERR